MPGRKIPQIRPSLYSRTHPQHTSQEHSMPFVPPRQSTSPSGAAALPLGSCATDSSSATDTTTEDEVVYIRTQKPVPEEHEWDTSDEEGHKPSAVIKSSSIGGTPTTPAGQDDDGFTPGILRQNRKTRKTQTPATPFFETQSQVSQKQRKPTQLC